MLLRQVRASLFFVQLVALATLLRSIAYDRWITVLAAVLLLVGATAAQRGRSWGVALTFAQAMAFPVAWMVGIAPAWFCLVGLIGALPFLLTSGAFARFDKGATRLLAALAVTGGAAGAIAWKEWAWSVFDAFPSLTPSAHLHHPLVVALVAAFGAYWVTGRRREIDDTRVRVAEGVRIAAPIDAEAEEALDADFEEEAVSPPRRLRRGPGP